jgi:SAM-dependent methyltransferase
MGKGCQVLDLLSIAIDDHSYAAASVWDRRHRSILADGDGDSSSLWLDPFLPRLTGHGCRRVLDLGCGTGLDAIDLARLGFEVEGVDYSRVAVDEAKRLAEAEGLAIGFRQGDIGLPLPYPDRRFDAVISNLVLHSFADILLRRIVAEVGRCLRPGGLFLFHVNSTEDVERRLAVQPPERRLGPHAYVLAGGQTMHFLGRDDIEALLAGWLEVELQAVTGCSRAGNPLKSAWRCAARKPS